MSQDTEQLEPLVTAQDSQRFRERWQEIQRGFVDEPRDSVREADELVKDLMNRLTETFHRERKSLESQLDEEKKLSTEDLRVGLQRYRSFFERLLAT